MKEHIILCWFLALLKKERDGATISKRKRDGLYEPIRKELPIKKTFSEKG